MDVFLLLFLYGCTSLSKSFIINLAEGVGFEPTDPRGSPVFKTGAIDHSAIPPIRLPDLIIYLDGLKVNGKRRRLFSQRRSFMLVAVKALQESPGA